MSDFANSSTLLIRYSESDSEMLAPWVVITRAQAVEWDIIPVKYRKWVVDHIEEMTPAEKLAVDLAILQAGLDDIAGAMDRQEDVTRALALTILDELNAHAAKVNSILDAMDAATSLADLKSRVALIADYPARTAQQLKTTIRQKLEG